MNKIILDDIEEAKKLYPRVLKEVRIFFANCCKTSMIGELEFLSFTIDDFENIDSRNKESKFIAKLCKIKRKDISELDLAYINDCFRETDFIDEDYQALSFRLSLPTPKVIENISHQVLDEICEIVKNENYHIFGFYMHYNDYFEKLLEINLQHLLKKPENEVTTDYLNYAIAVISSHSLPDVRDGLKPVQRRLLYAMDSMGARPDNQFRKSANIVYETMLRYHPYGYHSLYNALVSMAQEFSFRYPLVKGQGNFGTIYGDSPSSMRYTEARISHMGTEMNQELQKETVSFVTNYRGNKFRKKNLENHISKFKEMKYEKEPTVLPSAFPNLLVNGSSGIAAEMETNMPPHNLVEICDAICAQIDNPNISIDELMRFVQGPDFPTGGVIIGNKGIREIYETGRGKLQLRGKFTIETTKRGKEQIVFYKIPYNTNFGLLLKEIDQLVREKVLDGIANVKDESTSDMRIVIKLKKGAVVNDVLNQLFSNTQLQTSFEIINLALVDGKPQYLNLKELIHHFVKHRVEIVTRRTNYDLRKAEERKHILEGLLIIMTNIDEAFAIIKASRDGTAAHLKLQERFLFSEAQLEAIVGIHLMHVTGLEIEKLQQELEEIKRKIAHYKSLLADEKELRSVIRDETKAIAEKYGDARRTEIVDGEAEYFSHSIAI